jgi:hypothetical protein
MAMVIRKARGATTGGGFNRSERDAVEVGIMRRCGHEETIKIFGDPGTSRYYAAQELQDCRKCKNAVFIDEDNAAVKAGKRVALEGSERQAPWAQTIRSVRAAAFAEYMAGARLIGQKLFLAKKLTAEQRESGLLAVKEAIVDLMMGDADFNPDEYGQHSGHARWWIDAKDLTARAIIALLVPERDVMGGMFGGDDDDYSGIFILADVAPAAGEPSAPRDAWDREEAQARAIPPAKAVAVATDDQLDLDDFPF